MKNLVLIPAYNEEASLPRTIASLQILPRNYELLVINDGSADRTGKIAEDLSRTSRLKMHVLHLPMNCGIGGAVQTGYRFAMREGVYQFVIQFDADGQHEASYIEPMVNKCMDEDLDLCVGSRFVVTGQCGFRSTGIRRVGIRFFAWLISALSRNRVTDPTSGFRCASPRAWMSFSEWYPDDYPEPESLFWCARNKLSIGELPVRMHPRQGGTSSIRSFRSFYYMLKVSMAILVDRLRLKEYIAHEC